MPAPKQPITRALLPDLADPDLRGAWLNAQTALDGVGVDYSAAGNDGTAFGQPATLERAGASLDGVDDRVDFGDVGDIQQIGMWIKPGSTTEQIVLVDTGAYVHVVAGTVTYVNLTAAATYVNGAASTTLVADEWQYLVCQFTQVDANNFELGWDEANYGDIDVMDLRAYDAQKTAAWVAYEFKRGVPDDSLSFHTVGGDRDLSRYERPITNWNDVTVGSEMRFAGAAPESLEMPALELTAGMTVSLWFNADALASTVLFNDVIHLDRRLVIKTELLGEMRAGYWQGAVYRSASGTCYEANRWHHVYCTWDADETCRLWVDAVEQTGGVDPSSGNGIALRLGASTGGTSPFAGRMRDVRVWQADKGEAFGQVLDRAQRPRY